MRAFTIGGMTGFWPLLREAMEHRRTAAKTPEKSFLTTSSNLGNEHDGTAVYRRWKDGDRHGAGIARYQLWPLDGIAAAIFPPRPEASRADRDCVRGISSRQDGDGGGWCCPVKPRSKAAVKALPPLRRSAGHFDLRWYHDR